MRDKIINEFINSDLNIIDINKLYQYVDHCLENNTTSNDNTEKHHILPKAKTLFPQYSCFRTYEWNMSIMTYRNHYIAHTLLAEAIKEPSITYAWHSMNSINKNNNGVEMIGEDRYDYLRREHKKCVISYNKTREITDEFREKMSEAQKKVRNGKTFFDSAGLVPVYDNELKKYTTIPKDVFDTDMNNRYSHNTKNKVAVRFWDCTTGQVTKEEFYNDLSMGGTTSKRYIVTDNEGNVFNIRQMGVFIKNNNLPGKLKDLANTGVITYKQKVNQFGVKTDINGWDVVCLD